MILQYGALAAAAACAGIGSSAFSQSPQPYVTLAPTRAVSGVRRAAFVVGVSRYHRSPPLIAAVHDAAATAEVLRSLGFTVFLTLNPSLSAHDEARKAFWNLLEHEKNRSTDTNDRALSLFYYAGHGYSDETDNLMVIEEGDKTYHPSASECVRYMELTSSAAIAVFDACRVPAHASSENTSGRLHQMDKGQNLVVLYASKPGEAAIEPTPYTTDPPRGYLSLALERVLQVPGLEIRTAFTRASKIVEQQLKQRGHPGKHAPTYTSSLTDDLFLRPQLNNAH